ncbi:MAG: hypothetical protein R3208_19650 [Ketobacteraceae bacterium]|nr:hypothetical protein [Ketobacteraceae bacterium]
MKFSRDTISENGWCQGASVKLADIENLNDFVFSASNLKKPGLLHLLVISQDCDILVHSAAEPHVECLLLKEIPDNKTDPRFTSWRDPRKIQFQVNDRWFECQAKDITLLNKDYLLEHKATNDLSDKGLDISQEDPELLKNLKFWKANRYIRTGLPNEFVELTRDVFDTDSLKAFLASFREHIEHVMIEIIPFSENDQYQCGVFLIVNDKTPTDQYEAIEQGFYELIADPLDGTDQITSLIDSESYEEQAINPVMREREVPLSLLNRFEKFYFDYISFQPEDDQH